MHRLTIRSGVVAIALGGLLLAGCGGDSYSGADLKHDLQTKVQLDAETADCVVDEVEAKGIEISGFEGETLDEAVPADQHESFIRVLTDCVMAGSDLQIPELTTPDGDLPGLGTQQD